MSPFSILLELRMWRWWVVTTGAVTRAKLQWNCHHRCANTQFFTGRMPFLSPNQQCQSTEGKSITFHKLTHVKLNWGLSTLFFTTKGCCLLWARVVRPFISPLMPVPTVWRLNLIAPFAVTINSNVCPHIRVLNSLMRASYAWRHRTKLFPEHVRQLYRINYDYF